jgi:predicted nucleotidyltransferase
VAHRFHHTKGVAIDVVPFGGIERENGSITMPQEDTHMVVLGFQEVLENAVGVDIGRGISIPVATPPGLAVLKVFAYQDRRRTEDLRDLWFILENYDRAGNEERIFHELSHLLSEGALEYDVAGAYLLGSDAARMITGKTREHLLIALAQFSDPYSPDFAPLVSRLGDEREEETERIRVSQLFNSFRSGIERAV